MQESSKWRWFCSIPGLYRNDRMMLLQCFGGPEDVKGSNETEIGMLPFLNEKQKAVLTEWKNKSEDEILTEQENKKIHFAGCEDEMYPEKLKELPDHPYGLFYRGELPGKEERCAAVVGARQCTNYGRMAAGDIACALAENGIAVVSGMAWGIDGISQAAALEAGGRSYAVLGCGVDICYPREHIQLFRDLEDKGGIISEYPPGTAPIPLNFPARNRIISGISEKVLVIEAKMKSGSLITADMALEQGRDVLALPGKVTDPLSRGCNHLIYQGAGIITDRKHLLSQFGIEETTGKKMKKKNYPLATSENMVYICLDFQPKSLSDIVRITNMPVQEVMSILVTLQEKGYAVEVAKNYYTAARQ